MKQPYGVALIINIKNFEGTIAEGVSLETRRGSDVDLDKLEVLWRELGFTVKTRIDLKAHEIYTAVHDTAKDTDCLQTSSCFVCCIMTHGDMGMIYGSDSASLNIKDITDLFKEENCKPLTEKPKLFFIQACRGRQHLTGRPPIPPTSGTRSTNAVAQAESDVDYVNDSTFRYSADPNEPHFLLGYSTAPGKQTCSHALFLAIIDTANKQPAGTSLLPLTHRDKAGKFHTLSWTRISHKNM